MNKNVRNTLLLIGIPLLIVVIAISAMGQFKQSEDPTYSDMVQKFYNGQIEEFELNLSSGRMEYKEKGDTKAKVYEVPDVSIFYNDVGEVLTKEFENGQQAAETGTDVAGNTVIKYDYKVSKTSWIVSLLPTLLLVVVIAVFWIIMMRKMSGMGNDKAMGFGKARYKKADDKKKTTFADVAGADEEKEELAEIVEFLKNPTRFNDMGARIPKGVLLVGPPGTGKTLLARAVAGEAGVPFYSISGSDFVEMFVGVGASRVRDLFGEAKKNSPAIVFIDEIDAVGRQRGTGLGGGHDEREQTLNQLLVEMDGFGPNEGVIVIAATNRSDVLDPALLRPGRFDRQIVVGYPDVKGREAILKVHSRGKPLGPDVDLKIIAQTTAGFTGADLENLLNEAALLAARKKAKAIVESDIEEATIKVVMGVEKKSRVIKDKDKLITSYHEAGHAIVSYFLPTQDEVHQISIIPRGMAAGYTMYRPADDQSHTSRQQLKEQICSLLGGRVAEELTQSDICTGASNDLQRATEMAQKMIMKYGMSEKLGPVVYGKHQEEVFLGRDFNSTPTYSDRVAAEIDAEIRALVEGEYDHAKQILTDHMEKLHEIAKYLFENEKMDADTFRAAMDESAPQE
ncbi:MAG: ATP-dependent zinc metalloprotease FtsH [Clostridia bacterium]|nr:ATP-dependent zinc metalloprotease FtsH [Clostridia bacterium]